jgi:hypothetical protein
MQLDLIPPVFSWLALPAIAAFAGAAAIAAPVIIHLLTQQRFQIVEWAAMRFLQVEQKRHRRRIDHWPLMVSRVLAVGLVLLGLCASTPWAESIWQKISPGSPEFARNAPRTHHIIVLDASLSMSTQVGNRTRFDIATEHLKNMLSNPNPGDGFSLITLAGSTNVVVPGPANDINKLLNELPNIKLTHAQADIGSALTSVSEIVARSPRNYPRRQVTFISDIQRSTWSSAVAQGEKPAPDVWQKILGRADVAVVDVAGNDLDNLAVTDLALADPLPLVDQPVVIMAAVQNFGKSDRRGVRVELLVGRSTGDARALPIEQKLIESIPPGERATVSFTLDQRSRFREAGLHVVQVRIVDNDELPADDIRQMVVEVRSSVNVVVVNGRASSDVVKRASGYLPDALSPGGKVIPGNPIQLRVLSMSEFLDAGIGDLTQADCVVLCDVPSLTPAQIIRIESVLKRGGGVIIGLGPQSALNIGTLNRQLFDDGKGLLPGKLVSLVESSKNNKGQVEQPGFRLAADDESFRKPPLDGFRDDNARGGLTSVPFKSYIKVAKDDRARRIMSFVPATPIPGDMSEPDAAVLEMSRHRGRVVLLTTSWNTDWTDWPVLPSFLPRRRCDRRVFARFSVWPYRADSFTRWYNGIVPDSTRRRWLECTFV